MLLVIELCRTTLLCACGGISKMFPADSSHWYETESWLASKSTSSLRLLSSWMRVAAWSSGMEKLSALRSLEVGTAWKVSTPASSQSPNNGIDGAYSDMTWRKQEQHAAEAEAGPFELRQSCRQPLNLACGVELDGAPGSKPGHDTAAKSKERHFDSTRKPLYAQMECSKPPKEILCIHQNHRSTESW